MEKKVVTEGLANKWKQRLTYYIFCMSIDPGTLKTMIEIG